MIDSALLHPEAYRTIAWLFPRLLGIIYFFAFFPFLFQIRGLIGKEGILPLSEYLDQMKMRLQKRRFHYIPTLFWLNSSDTALMALTAVGVLLSLLLVAGVYPALLLVLLYILYLSIVSAGQDFLSFGWEGYLLEITVHAFLISVTTVPNAAVWLSANLLLFRFHFQAGLVKIQSQDLNWRNLTAVGYHYQSQPLPNTQAWYVFKLPLWFHKASTAMMFFLEMALPFFLFLGDEWRLFTFAGLAGLQLVIWFTGNFSYLNHLTLVFCVILLADRWLPFEAVPVEKTPLALAIPLTIAGAILATLQVLQLLRHTLWHPFLNRLFLWLQPFHLVNRYGIFAVMTTKRYEIIIEGSADGKVWKEYLFRYKPSEVNRRPRRISPYQPRLDWQAWFLPFTTFEREDWFQSFLIHLLRGTKPVVGLLRHNPFPDAPPKYIHALVYDYRFSDAKTKKMTGEWWLRTLVGAYSPTLSLKD